MEDLGRLTFQHSPSSWRVDILHSQLANHWSKNLLSQWFGQNVCKLMRWAHMSCNNGTILDLVPNIVTIHLNVSSTLMENRVGCNAALLSQCSKTGSWCKTPKSFKRYRSHVNSQQAPIIARYSASTKESDTVFYCFDLQEISEGPRNTQ